MKAEKVVEPEVLDETRKTKRYTAHCAAEETKLSGADQLSFVPGALSNAAGEMFFATEREAWQVYDEHARAKHGLVKEHVGRLKRKVETVFEPE